MARCAPTKKFSNGTCFTIDSLIKIANKYNKTFNDKINLTTDLITDKKALLRELAIKMKGRYNCDNDVCWLTSKVVRSIDDNDIKHGTFRPIGPKNQYDWLSTNDINNAMRQYERKYIDFKFFGAVPYDFADLPYFNMSDIDFSKLYNTTHKLGAVINLDEHNMPGSHWVALYVDLHRNIIYYFDSFGKKPGRRINLFVRKILTFMYNKKSNTHINVEEFMKKYHTSDDYDVRYNRIQHQFKNSECGVYSMNFIIRLLGGESFDSIVNDIMNDDAMNECRKTYFRN